MKNNKVLLLDNDAALTIPLSKFLRQSGFSVRTNDDFTCFERYMTDFEPDVVIMEVAMSSESGMDVCSKMREMHNGGIIIYTRLNDDIDQVTGLEMGADAYLVKPLRPRVLLAYVRSQIRQSTRIEKSEVIVCGELSIELDKREVRKNGVIIEFTTSEFDLLWLLAIKKGDSVSRKELYEKMYQLDYDGVDRSIDLRVSRLRKKLGMSLSKRPYIITVRNMGYLLSNL